MTPRRSSLSRNQTFTLILAVVAIVVAIFAAFVSGHDWFPKSELDTTTHSPSPAPNGATLHITQEFELSPNSTLPDGRIVFDVEQTITATMRIKNTGTEEAVIDGLGVAVRGPSACDQEWRDNVLDFPTVKLTLRPGEEYVYQQMRSFGDPGTYFAEPLVKLAGRDWGGIPLFRRTYFFVRDPQTGSVPNAIDCVTPVPISGAVSTSTPTPSFTSPAAVLFEDKFIDNRNDWETPGSAYIASGKYTFWLACPPDSSADLCQTYIKIPFEFPKNFRLEVDFAVRETFSFASIALGIQVRRNNSNHYYLNYFISDKYYLLSAIYKTDHMEIIRKTTTDLMATDAGSINRLGIELRDTVFTPLINGQALAEAEDGNMPDAGESYLVIFVTRGVSEIIDFDNLVVQEVP